MLTVHHFTTGPQTRKRKANDSFEDANKAKALKKAPVLDRPATPLTEPGSPTVSAMESEDEFLSDVTSQEDEDFDEGTQDSDDGSLGQGRSKRMVAWTILSYDADRYSA